VYVGFIGEKHPARVLILQSGFKGMEASSFDLERVRHESVLVQGVSHFRVGKLDKDAVLDGHFDHLPLPNIAARAGDARAVFLDGHLQAKDNCGLVQVEHRHAPPTVDDGQLAVESVRDIPPAPADRPYSCRGNLLGEIFRLLLSRKTLLDKFGPIRLLFIRCRTKMKRIGLGDMIS
jgi:hypothetical protein